MHLRERYPQHCVLPLGVNAVIWLRSPLEAAVEQAWLEQADRRHWPVAQLFTAEPVVSLGDLREACQALLALRDFAEDLALSRRCLPLADYRLAALLHGQSRLGIHRNTLRYRLERIAQLSGLDLDRADHRSQLSLSMTLQGEVTVK